MTRKIAYINSMHEISFKDLGLKRTKARLAVWKVLRKAERPYSAEDVAKKLRKENINLSTVYRTLNAFAESGIVKKEVNDAKENIFSIELEEDRHVLVCLRCHKSIPLAGCPYHEANEHIEQETGFLIQDHSTEIYGLCPDCQKK